MNITVSANCMLDLCVRYTAIGGKHSVSSWSLFQQPTVVLIFNTFKTNIKINLSLILCVKVFLTNRVV